MTVTSYWVGQAFVADWVLTDPDTGVFVAGATVAGVVDQPDGVDAAMTVTELPDRYQAVFDPTQEGRHAWRLTATGTADSAAEGSFTVLRSLTGAEPITVDPATNIGMVRTLATDLDEAAPLFTDAQIQAFLDLEGSVRLAAALALETIAVSEALVSKKIRTLDLQTDGPAVAKELRERAAVLRKQAADADIAADVFTFDVVDYDPYFFDAELVE